MNVKKERILFKERLKASQNIDFMPVSKTPFAFRKVLKDICKETSGLLGLNALLQQAGISQRAQLIIKKAIKKEKVRHEGVVKE